jgi:hypothetical protein
MPMDCEKNVLLKSGSRSVYLDFFPVRNGTEPIPDEIINIFIAEN